MPRGISRAVHARDRQATGMAVGAPDRPPAGVMDRRALGTRDGALLRDDPVGGGQASAALASRPDRAVCREGPWSSGRTAGEIRDRRLRRRLQRRRSRVTCQAAVAVSRWVVVIRRRPSSVIREPSTRAVPSGSSAPPGPPNRTEIGHGPPTSPSSPVGLASSTMPSSHGRRTAGMLRTPSGAPGRPARAATDPHPVRPQWPARRPGGHRPGPSAGGVGRGHRPGPASADRPRGEDRRVDHGDDDRRRRAEDRRSAGSRLGCAVAADRLGPLEAERRQPDQHVPGATLERDGNALDGQRVDRGPDAGADGLRRDAAVRGLGVPCPNCPERLGPAL